MKKTNTIFAILVLAVICTAFSVSGTYARYITTDSGTGTATVAKWNAVVTGWGGTTTAQTLTLNPVSNPYVATGLIAPDADAVGILTVNLTGTQVAVDLKATLGTVTVNGVTVTGDPTSHFTPVLKIYEGTATDEAIGKDIQGVTGGATPLATITTANPKYYIPLNGTTISKTSVKVAVGIHWEHSDTTEGWNAWDTTVGEYETTAPTIEATINLTAQQHVLSDGNP